ncbi:MAG: hypothetical protein D6750_09325 [Bacteroidetes bacterium]|nr:MAG: hypothetical protein D6750_09325 [Bacteroidota bacterium]
MATWRNWLKSLLPWTEKPASESPTPQAAAPPAGGPAPSLAIPPITEPIRLLPLREWTVRFISPYAWDRAIIRLLPLLREERIPLPEVLNPTPTTTLPPTLAKNLLLALQEMYGTIPPVAVLNGVQSPANP